MALERFERPKFRIKKAFYTGEYVGIVLQIKYAGRAFEDTIVMTATEIAEFAGYRTGIYGHGYYTETESEIVVGDYLTPRWYTLKELPEPPKK